MGFGGGGHRKKKKTALKGRPSKKNKGKGGGHVKYYLYLRGGRGKKFSYWGGVMQLFNDTSKNSTTPPTSQKMNGPLAP